MGLKLANNAVSRLAASVSNSDTTFALAPGSGALFPTLSAGDWFPLSLIDAAGNIEVTRVTARSTDTLTVERGQEGSLARAFGADTRVELRTTKAAFEEIQTAIANRLPLSGGTIAGDLYLSRPATPATGALFFGNAGTKYLYYDGTNYAFSGGQLIINGGTAYHSGNFNPAAYMPLAGGTFSGNYTISNTSPTITLADTDWGTRSMHCNGGLVGFLTSAGNWGCYSQNDGTFIAAGNIGAYSDRKFKKKITTIKGGLELIERMRGVRYIDKRSKQARVGVIAQEVQEVFPEVVGEGPDGLHVDYGNLVGPLIQAVKELAQRVRELEAR